MKKLRQKLKDNKKINEYLKKYSFIMSTNQLCI